MRQAKLSFLYLCNIRWPAQLVSCSCNLHFLSRIPVFSLSSLLRHTNAAKETNILLQRVKANLWGKYRLPHHIPRTTSLTGDDVRASWVVKSEAVTWHSHSPSSNSSVAALTQRLQSPDSWLPAHSYFLGYIPTGCNRRLWFVLWSLVLRVPLRIGYMPKPFHKHSKKSDYSGRKEKYCSCIQQSLQHDDYKCWDS